MASAKREKSCSSQSQTSYIERMLCERINAGLRLGYDPVLASDGTGGAYFLKDETAKNIAVFKPSDEEPGYAVSVNVFRCLR